LADSSVLCPNGHPNPTGQRFCGICGVEVSTEMPTGSQAAAPPQVASADSPQVPSQRASWLRPIVLVPAVVVLLGIILALLWGFGVLGGKQEVTGTFSLLDPEGYEGTDPCFGTGGYSDIGTGAQVIVTDRAGTVIASGDLGPGKVESVEGFQVCQFSFVVDVPATEFYRFEVGDRGSITYTNDELEREGWHVDFTLGEPFDFDF
jgi:hypothetical protein